MEGTGLGRRVKGKGGEQEGREEVEGCCTLVSAGG